MSKITRRLSMAANETVAVNKTVRWLIIGMMVVIVAGALIIASGAIKVMP